MRIPAPSPDASYAALVFDDDGTQPRRFRSTTSLPPGERDTDLASLRCSGSAQPSVPAFRELKLRLAIRDEDLHVVDLRQESHGFVNDDAVSWYATSNWGAAGLTDEDALSLEALRLRLLGLAHHVQIGSVETIKRGAPPSIVDRSDPRVASEAQAFALPPGRYIRLPVTDHARPSDAVVDRFVTLVRGLRGSEHLHLHCRGGKGRTATFMALLDMLRNAWCLPLATILSRQAELGSYDLTRRADPATPKAPFIDDRLAFLERFHAYARHNRDGAEPWSTWARRTERP
jgi:hypothetical protein